MKSESLVIRCDFKLMYPIFQLTSCAVQINHNKQNTTSILLYKKLDHLKSMRFSATITWISHRFKKGRVSLFSWCIDFLFWEMRSEIEKLLIIIESIRGRKGKSIKCSQTLLELTWVQRAPHLQLLWRWNHKNAWHTVLGVLSKFLPLFHAWLTLLLVPYAFAAQIGLKHPLIRQSKLIASEHLKFKEE